MSKKWVLSSLVAFFLLVFCFQWFFQSGFISEKARRFVESGMEELLGQKVSIGSAYINLFSASVDLKEISIGPQELQSPYRILAVGVRIAFSPWSLFTEALVIKEIEIDSPRFDLTQQTLNEKQFIFLRSAPDEVGPPPRVIVRSVMVREGAITYKGEEGLKEVTLAKVYLDVNPDLKMDRFEIALSGEKGFFSTEGDERRIDRLEVKAVVYPDKIDLKKGWVASSRMTFMADGVFRIGQEDPFDFRFDVRLPIEAFDLTRFSEAGDTFWDGKKLSGEATLFGHLTGSYTSPVMKGRMALSHLFLDGREIGSFASGIDYESGKVTFDALSGEVFSGSLSGSGEGRLTALVNTDKGSDDPPRYRVNLQYTGLSLDQAVHHLLGGDERGSRLFEGIFLDGDIVLSGRRFDGEDLTAAGHLVATRRPLFSPSLPAGSKRFPMLVALFKEGGLVWQWSDHRLRLDRGRIGFPDTTVGFHGEWNREKGFTLETKFQSDQIQKVAESLRFPLTGRMSLNGVLEGRIDNLLYKGDVLLEKWTLRDHSMGTLSSHLIYENRRVSLKRGFLMDPATNRSTDARKRRQGEKASPPYRFEGDIGLEDFQIPSFDLQVDVESADPHEVLTFFKRPIPLRTAATGRLSIKGTRRVFSVRGPLILSKGTLYGESFDWGKLKLTVTEKEVRLRNVVLEMKRSRLVGEGEIGYRGTVRGTYRLALRGVGLQIQKARFFQLRIPFLAGEVALKVFGEGSLKAPRLKVTADVRDFQYGGMDRASGAVTVDWNDRSVKFEGTFPEKNFFLSGEVLLEKAYPFSFRSRFDRFQFGPFFKAHFTGLLSRVGLQLTGKLEGKGKLSHLDQVSLSGSFIEMAADFNGYLIHNDGDMFLHSEEGTFFFKDARFKGENTSLVFNGSLTLLRSWNLMMNGEADLNLIKFFTREISSGKGKASLDLQVSDHWKRPHIQGMLHLENGKIWSATFSRAVQVDSFSAVFNQDHLILESFEGRIGGGRFRASGKADFSGLEVEGFGFLLILKNAGVKLFPDLTTTIDGELFFQRNGKGQVLKGELKLKNAVYEKRVDLKSFINEFIKRKEKVLSTETPFIGRTRLNIHLYGNEGIWINNNLAKIPLAMDLFLRGAFDKPLLVGRIDLPRGKIFLRRNHFRVVSGSIDFLDQDKINPTFDIKAKTEVRNYATDQTYTVDLSLAGTLSHVILTLASSPSLPEADILALLTLGKTTADLAPGGAGGEATAFVVSALLEEPVQKITGFDRIQINPTTGDADDSKSSNSMRLTAEKRLLEDRLIVVYSTTLDPSEEDLIRMVYEVSKNISLVGDRDDRGRIGGDIRFRFEFR